MGRVRFTQGLSFQENVSGMDEGGGSANEVPNELCSDFTDHVQRIRIRSWLAIEMSRWLSPISMYIPLNVARIGYYTMFCVSLVLVSNP